MQTLPYKITEFRLNSSWKDPIAGNLFASPCLHPQPEKVHTGEPEDAECLGSSCRGNFPIINIRWDLEWGSMVPNERGKKKKTIKRENNSQPCNSKRGREVVYLLCVFLSQVQGALSSSRGDAQMTKRGFPDDRGVAQMTERLPICQSACSPIWWILMLPDLVEH